MSPDPFFHPDLEQIRLPNLECAKACPEAGSGGFCGARIHPDCLRIDRDGMVRVALSVPVSTWFTTLAQWGDVLQVSRNSVSAVGQFGVIPVLTDWQNPVLPHDRLNSFIPNLAEYASLWAIREQSPTGAVYGLEACDTSGLAFHRVYLTTVEQRERFEQFVTCHQSPPTEARHWFSPNHGMSIRRCRALKNRVAILRSSAAKVVKDARPLTKEVIPRLLAAAAKARLPLRTTHYHRALVRAVVWLPDTLESLPGEKNGQELLQGDGVGLRVDLAAVGGVWLWQGQCSGCDKRHWTVEAADAEDFISLAFTVGDERLEPHWRDLLEGCLS